MNLYAVVLDLANALADDPPDLAHRQGAMLDHTEVRDCRADPGKVDCEVGFRYATGPSTWVSLFSSGQDLEIRIIDTFPGASWPPVAGAMWVLDPLRLLVLIETGRLESAVRKWLETVP